MIRAGPIVKLQAEAGTLRACPMKLIYDFILGFVTFSAVAVLFASLIGLAIWLLVEFAKALDPDGNRHP